MEYFPVELLDEIFKRMDYEELCACMRVCQRWRKIIKSRKNRAELELSPLIDGIVYVPLNDTTEFQWRRIAIRARAAKWGYLYPREVRGGYLNF